PVGSEAVRRGPDLVGLRAFGFPISPEHLKVRRDAEMRRTGPVCLCARSAIRKDGHHMSLREHQQPRARGKLKNRNPAPAIPLAPTHPNQILTFPEWCRLNRVSVRTGRRILNSGTGPAVTQLSPKRIGITIGNNALWQKSKERA